MRAITGFGGKVKRPEVDPPRPESRSRNRKLDEVMPWPADYFGIHDTYALRASSPLATAGEGGVGGRRTGIVKP